MSAGAFAMGNPRAHVRAWAAPSLLLLALTLWSLIGTSAGLGCAAREWDTSPPSKDVCFLAQTYLMGRAELGAPGAQQSSDPDVYTVDTLDHNFVGQRHVTDNLKRLLLQRASGLYKNGEALCIVLLGPSGVGKTELSRRIASILHNRPVADMEKDGSFVQFNMAAYHDREGVQSFVGAAPGYQGQAPMRKVFEEHPDAVVLLDEFEKGHCDGIPQLLLKMLEKDGRVPDKKDPTANVPTTNATFIIASNFAHEAVERAWGMSDRGKAGLALVRARVMEEMRTTPCQWPDRKNPFGPALRNRIGDEAMFVFVDFSEGEIAAAVKLQLRQLAHDHRDTVSLFWTKDAVAMLTDACLKDSEMGQRETGLRRVTDRVKQMVNDALMPLWEQLRVERCLGRSANTTVVLDRYASFGRPATIAAFQLWWKEDAQDERPAEEVERCRQQARAARMLTAAASVPVVHEPAAVWSEEQAIAQPPQVQSPHQALLPEASLDTQKLYAKMQAMQERLLALDSRVSTALDMARKLSESVALLQYALAAVVVVLAITGASAVWIALTVARAVVVQWLWMVAMGLAFAVAVMLWLFGPQALWALLKAAWQIWSFLASIGGFNPVVGALVLLCAACAWVAVAYRQMRSSSRNAVANQAVARGLGASGARPVVIDAEFLQLMLKHAGAEAHTVASSTGHSEAQQGTGMRENGSKVDAQGASTAARAADTRPHQARASAVENGGHVHRDSTQSTQTQEMGAQVAPEDAQLGHVENVVSRTVAS